MCHVIESSPQPRRRASLPPHLVQMGTGVLEHREILGLREVFLPVPVGEHPDRGDGTVPGPSRPQPTGPCPCPRAPWASRGIGTARLSYSTGPGGFDGGAGCVQGPANEKEPHLDEKMLKGREALSPREDSRVTVSVWGIRFLSGKVSRWPVRPKMFHILHTGHTTASQQPHENIKKNHNKEDGDNLHRALTMHSTESSVCNDPSILERCDREVPLPPYRCGSISGGSEGLAQGQRPVSPAAGTG